MCALNLAALYKEFGNTTQDPDLAGRLRAQLQAAERDFTALDACAGRHGSASNGLAQVASLRSDLPEVLADAAALRATLEQAVALAREALACRPDWPEYQAALVRNLDNLATQYNGQVPDAEVEPLLDEALAVARRIPRDARLWPSSAVLESDVLETLGNLYRRRGDDRTRATLAACVELREPLAHSHPDDIDLLTRLGGALHNLARTFCGDDATEADLDQAVTRLQRATELQRQVLQRAHEYERAGLFLRNHLRLLGNTLVRLRRPAAAEPIVAELAACADSAVHLQSVARMWLRIAALHAESGTTSDPPRDHATLAMQALLAAERTGWAGRSRLDEEVYAPLRGRPDFVALRARLVAAQDTVSPPSTNSASREMPR